MRLNLNPQTFWKLQGLKDIEKLNGKGYDGKHEVAQLFTIPIYVSELFNNTLEL